MSELSTGSTEPSPPVVEFAPPDIARRHIATWNGLQTDAVEVVRREPFAYGYRASRHLLIMCERAERDDGETLVEGLPRSTLHEYSHKLSFVPAGHQFSGWQKPRALTRVTYFYIDPQRPPDRSRAAFRGNRVQAAPFLLRQGLVGNGAKAQGAGQDIPDAAHRQYAEALSVVMVHELLRLNNTAVPQSSPFEAALPAGRRKRWRSISTSTCSRTFRWRIGRRREAEPLSFRACVQAIIRPAAASLSEQPSHATGQDSAGQSRHVGDAGRLQPGFQRHQFLYDHVSQAYRTDAYGLSPKPGMMGFQRRSRSSMRQCRHKILRGRLNPRNTL